MLTFLLSKINCHYLYPQSNPTLKCTNYLIPAGLEPLAQPNNPRILFLWVCRKADLVWNVCPLQKWNIVRFHFVCASQNFLGHLMVPHEGYICCVKKKLFCFEIASSFYFYFLFQSTLELNKYFSILFGVVGWSYFHIWTFLIILHLGFFSEK